MPYVEFLTQDVITRKQLGQLRPANTTAASLYSPAANTQAIIRSITICNTSGAAAAFRIFLDDNGTTYDETTAHYWDISVGADATVSLDVFWAMNDSTGNLAVRTDTNDAFTFTAYGEEIT
jgi:hypothetical protein